MANSAPKTMSPITITAADGGRLDFEMIGCRRTTTFELAIIVQQLYTLERAQT